MDDLLNGALMRPLSQSELGSFRGEARGNAVPVVKAF